MLEVFTLKCFNQKLFIDISTPSLQEVKVVEGVTQQSGKNNEIDVRVFYNNKCSLWKSSEI